MRLTFAGLMLAAMGFASCTDDGQPAETPDAVAVTPENGSDNGTGGTAMSDNTLNITVSGTTFTCTLDTGETATAFKERLPMTITMNELNGNEKYHYMSDGLPTNSCRPGTIEAGDLMLYGSDCLVLFYKTFSSSYSYTRIGKIGSPVGLASAVGTGNVSVTFSLPDEEDVKAAPQEVFSP